jgi:hypothetical protein
MVAMCKCAIRKCKHLQGVKQPDGTEEGGEYWVCAAFPDAPEGIPEEIAFGDNLHLEPYPGDHGIQYEKE